MASRMCPRTGMSSRGSGNTGPDHLSEWLLARPPELMFSTLTGNTRPRWSGGHSQHKGYRRLELSVDARRAAYLFPACRWRQEQYQQVGDGVDVRGDGGLVIFWYAAGCPCLNHDPAAPWPTWLLECVQFRRPPPVIPDRLRTPEHAGKAVDGILRRVATAAEGSRNGILFWGAVRLAERARASQIGSGRRSCSWRPRWRPDSRQARQAERSAVHGGGQDDSRARPR